MESMVVIGQGAGTLVLLAGLCLLLAGVRLGQSAADRGGAYWLRPIAALEAISRLVSQLRGDGCRAAVSPGAAQLGTATTVEALAGLVVAEYLVERGDSAEIPVTMANADGATWLVAHVAAANFVSPATLPEEHPIQFISPDRAALAAGVAVLLGGDTPSFAALVGRWGDEALLIAPAAERGSLVGGTGEAVGLAVLELAAEEVARGEEVYAADAYLARRTGAVSGLVALDMVRLAVVLLLLVFLAFGLLGWGNLLW